VTWAPILRAARATLVLSAIALVALDGAAARPGAATASGGTLVIGMSRGDPDTLDPTVTGSFSSVEVLRTICERLYDFDVHSNVVPELASRRPRISKNKLTYTIPLRRGVRFNDGTPFNAQAVVTSLDRDLTLPTSQRRSDLSSIATITTRGSYAVRIHLKTPFSPLLATLATNDGIVMSPTQLTKLGANFGTDPVCVGPFMYASRAPGYSVTVVKSPYYYRRSSVHLDSIVFRVATDSAAAVSELEAGDVQVLDSVAPSELSAVRANKKLQLNKRGSLGWSGIAVNIGNKQGIGKFPYQNVGTPLAASPILRRAFEEAIDRRTLVRVVYSNAAVADCTPVARGTPGYESSISCTPYDPKAAAKLVAQSGYTNPTVHLLVPVSTTNLRLAQFVQAEEAAVGINVVIETADPVTVLQRSQNGSFDTYLAAWTGTPDIDRNVYQFVDTNGSRNVSGYSNKRLDSLLDAARRASDEKTENALHRQAIKILLTARPIVFLDHPTVYAGVSTSVKGVLFYSDIQLRAGFARFS
jgi:peptide/nickel transport system substrate-binding protein